MSRQPKVIVVANSTGGVGKTASAAGIAGELARKGSNVLAIDLAHQAGNLTAVLHQRDYIGPTVLSVLLGDTKLSTVVVPTKELRLFLLPACLQLLSQEKRLQSIPGYHNLLRMLLPELTAYDYVVIDCPPSLNNLTSLALAAADVYVVPCEPEPLAFDGLRDMVRVATIVRDNLNARLRLAGIFLTAYHPNQRGAVQQSIAELVRKTYGEQAMLPHIRKDRAVPMSQATGQSVSAHDAASNAAQDYELLTRAILKTLCADLNMATLIKNNTQNESLGLETTTFVPFANRISADNKRDLDRMAYWMPGTGKVQKILNAALAAYFAQQDPHDLRPMPAQ